MDRYIEKIPCKMLIDTGANVNTGNLNIADQVLRSDNQRRQDTSVILKSVNGERIPIVTLQKFEFEIGNFRRRHEAFVTEISDDCILGMEFLRCNGCSVDLQESVLRCGEEETVIFCKKIQVAPQQVVMVRNVTVLPNTETFLTVKNSNLVEGQNYILEPATVILENKGLMIARTVALGQTVPLRIINLSKKPIKIKKGTPVGTCEPIVSILSQNEASNTKETFSKQFPEGLETIVYLIRPSTKGSTSEVTERIPKHFRTRLA